MLLPKLGQAVYPMWWSNLTKVQTERSGMADTEHTTSKLVHTKSISSYIHGFRKRASFTLKPPFTIQFTAMEIWCNITLIQFLN